MKSNTLKSLLKLAAPVALSQLAYMVMQLIDTLFVGRLGAEAIGGTSIGNSIFTSFLMLGIGLLMGLDYLVSHAYGAKKIHECNRVLIQAVYMALLLSVPVVVLMFVVADCFDSLGVTHQVALQGRPYLRAVAWSMPAALVFTAFRQYLQAMGSAVPVMVILVFGNVLNAFGNWIFVFGRWNISPMGVAGSGLATCIARTVMVFALIGYVYVRDRKLKLGLFKTSRQWSHERMRSLIRLGAPAGIQMLLEVGVFATATMLVARLAPAQLAAHHIVLMIASFTFMVPLGLSSAAAVRVGQSLGAGDGTEARRAGWTGIVSGAAFMGCSGVILFLLSRPLMSVFTKDPQVIEMGHRLLLIAAFFQLFDGVQVTASGVLRGIGNTRASMLANLVGHWFVGLPVGVALCFWSGWGAPGLWVGLSVGLIAVALSLTAVWAKRSREVCT